MTISLRRSLTPARGLLAIIACAAPALAAWGGPLDPPAGPIASTPGPEPRIPISLATTPGDANSLFRISQPGSYYLTGTITGVVGKRGIEIAASGVTIDLNGFTLSGVAGSLDGIAADFSVDTVEVCNGGVRNWSGSGVNLAGFAVRACVIRSIRASINVGDGIRAGEGAVVVGCTANTNVGDGIYALSGSSIIDCTAAVNEARGINVSSACTVSRCTVRDNLGDGIGSGGGCSVTFCTSYNNSGDGIAALSGNTISNNTCRNNGVDGISGANACIITANACTQNGSQSATGAGIRASSSDSRIEANLCVLQDRGIYVAAGGNIVVRNVCSGNTVNWEIAANNYYGPIIDRSGVATAAVSGDSATETLGSANANANFTY